nr:TIGR02391 family protein [Kineosporia rhizophila]
MIVDPVEGTDNRWVTGIGSGALFGAFCYGVGRVGHFLTRAIGVYVGNENVASTTAFSVTELHPLIKVSGERLWAQGHWRAAVDEAARNVNHHLQQRMGIAWESERALVEMAFSKKDPEPSQPRLRPPGNRGLNTYNNRLEGMRSLGVACFAGIRNPSAHEAQLNWDRAYCFHLLCALSLFATWLDECVVDYR